MVLLDSTLSLSSSFFFFKPSGAVARGLVIIIQRDIIHQFKSLKLLDEYRWGDPCETTVKCCQSWQGCSTLQQHFSILTTHLLVLSALWSICNSITCSVIKVNLLFTFFSKSWKDHEASCVIYLLHKWTDAMPEKDKWIML